MAPSQPKGTRHAGKRKGLSMGFASKQKRTLDSSNDHLNHKLHELRQSQRELKQEREALEKTREEMRQAPSHARAIEILALNTLSLAGEAQSRQHLDPLVVTEYTERMRVDEESGRVLDPEGNPWEPVKVYKEQVDALSDPVYWVADGFHRVSAAQALGLDTFPCLVLEGTRRDAVRESLSANARHGLRRTRADKRRAVERALGDGEWRLWTDQRLADLCAVSRGMVTRIREELERSDAIPFEIALYSADGREFEREEPRHTMEPPARPRSARATKTKSRSPSQVGWGSAAAHLERADALELIIAYPEVETHYETLIKGLGARHISSTLALLLPLLDGSEWLWRGPSLLHALVRDHGFASPRVLYIKDLEKHMVLWSRHHDTSLETFLTRDKVLKALAPSAHVLCLGKVLDSWP